MASISLSLSLLFASLLVSGSMATGSSDQTSTSFIRTYCSRTLYPDLCYSSLSPYAPQVGHELVLLARFAMNVTVGSLRPLSSYITSILCCTPAHPSSSSDQEVAALKDCSELISDATDQVMKSEKEVTGLKQVVGPQVTLRIGNAQTWLSAAITYEDTCTDGFGDGNGGTGEDVEMKVRQKVKRAKQLSSISLALVNALVNSR